MTSILRSRARGRASTSVQGRRLHLLAAACLILFSAGVVGASHIEESPGDRVGEPSITAPGVHVVREALAIDFRSLAAGAERVEVRAHYQLRNDGAAQTHELCLAAAGAHITGVILGSRPVAAVARQQTAQPSADVASCFALLIAPGEQVLEVAYRALPDQVPAMLVKSFGLDYGFATAHGWGSLGELAVEVFLPPGWELLDAPEGLERAGEGETYRIRMASVPSQLRHFHAAREGHADLRPLAASTLRLHVAPARGPYETLFVLSQVFCWLAMLAPLVPAWWLWQRARGGRPVPWALRLLSLSFTLFVVYALPNLPHIVQRQWFPFGAANVFPIAWLLGAWLVGALLSVAAHVALGWRSQVRLA